jgi:3-oxoacyl-[acyl-carrier protein] reductase
MCEISGHTVKPAVALPTRPLGPVGHRPPRRAPASLVPVSLSVLITGGRGGLATALAQEFSSLGDRVQAPGRDELDVRDGKSVDAFVSKLDRLDVLVANAGIVRDATLPKLTNIDFNTVLDTNLRGVFLSVRAALRHMVRQRSGHLILIGSRSARYGPRGQAAYAAAKAGLVAFAQSVAREYGPRDVRCNVVLPGFLETKFVAQLTPERREAIRVEHALGRFNTPENAARFIAFLARLDNVSGQVFTLDSRIDRWA